MTRLQYMYISIIPINWKETYTYQQENNQLHFTNYRSAYGLMKQESICETRKDPQPPPIQMGIEYFVYMHMFWNITTFCHFDRFRHQRLVEFGQYCQKAHVHAKFVHLSLLPSLN